MLNLFSFLKWSNYMCALYALRGKRIADLSKGNMWNMFWRFPDSTAWLWALLKLDPDILEEWGHGSLPNTSWWALDFYQVSRHLHCFDISNVSTLWAGLLTSVCRLLRIFSPGFILYQSLETAGTNCYKLGDVKQKRWGLPQTWRPGIQTSARLYFQRQV